MNPNYLKEINKIEGPVDLTARVPASKSLLARAMVMAALSNGKCVFENVVLCDDTETMFNALRDLGFSVSYNQGSRSLRVRGESGRVPATNAPIYVGSAGTAARFLVALLGLTDGTHLVNASSQMEARPMKPLFDALTLLGAKVEYLKEEGHLPVKITGKSLSPESVISLEISVSESTQYASGILMVLGCLPNRSIVKLTDKNRDSYIKMTASMMKRFGREAIAVGDEYVLNQAEDWKGYIAGEYSVEPDVSGASYFYAIPLLTGGKASVPGVNELTLQGDYRFIELLALLGANVYSENGATCVEAEKTLEPESEYSFDFSAFSDQVATMAVIGAVRNKVTKITNIGHIRKQESDRIAVICENLEKCGIHCEATEDSLTVYGGKPHKAVIDPHNDHRIAMAFSLLGLVTEGIKITNPQCVEKTFRGFFDELPD